MRVPGRPGRGRRPDRSGAQAAGGLEIADAVSFLRGDWRIERQVTDFAAGASGTFTGTGRFTDRGAAELAYHEDGELRFRDHRGPASRSLAYRGRPDGTAEVYFADGRPFYHLDPRPGRWSAEHPCGADHYVLAGGAERDPDGTWLRSDAGELTFGGAMAAAARTAGALAAAGVRRGDLVMMTARNTPPYLISWLALAASGAVTMAVNPRSSPAAQAGLAAQAEPAALIMDASLAGLVRAAGLGQDPAEPAALITDASLTGLVGGAGLGQDPAGPAALDVVGLVPADWADPAAMARAAGQARLPDAGVRPADPAVLIPTSGTTGRSKLVIQTHRAYAMAGEGFPFWMELTAADRLMTSLPPRSRCPGTGSRSTPCRARPPRG